MHKYQLMATLMILSSSCRADLRNIDVSTKHIACGAAAIIVGCAVYKLSEMHANKCAEDRIQTDLKWLCRFAEQNATPKSVKQCVILMKGQNLLKDGKRCCEFDWDPFLKEVDKKIEQQGR